MKLKKGDILHITFLDHSLYKAGQETPIVLESFGRLIGETKRDYKLAYWIEPSGEVDHNTELFSIIKGAIIAVRKLK